MTPGYTHGGTMPRLTPEQAEVVENNSRLVWFWINRVGERREDEREEMFADGVFGLMRASQKYDASLGFTFSTYALFWIRQAIQRGRDQRGGVNIRRAERIGETWRPLSLDAAFGDDSDLNFADVIIDNGPSVEDVAAVEEIRRAIRDWARERDQIDRDIIDLMLSPDGDEKGAITAIARRWDIGYEVVRRRRRRLREHIRDQLQVA